MSFRPSILITGFLIFFACLPSFAQELLLEQYYSGNYPLVISSASASIASGDTAFNTYYLKALSESQLGQTTRAIQTLQLALDYHPEDPRFNRMLAGQFFEAGDYSRARIRYSSLVEEDSTDVSSWLKLADIASFRQQYDEAVTALNRVLAIDSMNLGSLMMMGEILDRHNNTGAVIYYERAYRYYPENQKAAYVLANQYIQIKEAQEAIPVCKKMLSLDSTSIKFRKLLGYAYYKAGDPQPAIEHFSLASSLGDSSAFTFKFLGICQYLTVDFQDAIQSLRLAVKKDSLDPEVHFFLGSSLATTIDKEEGTHHLEKSLELMQPESSVEARIYAELGNIKRLENEYEPALKLYEQAWKSDSTQHMYLYYMASILDNNMHRSKEALEVYRQYIDVVNQKRQPGNRDIQMIAIFTIVVDRVEDLEEELFFRDED